MKNQKYQVVIEDFLPKAQVLKLWKMLGMELIDLNVACPDNYHSNKGQFHWRGGVLIFHSAAKLLISTNEILTGIKKLNNQFSAINRQPMAKAFGLKNRGGNNWVLDGTLGLGKDYFLARSFGFDVLGVEKSDLCLGLISTATLEGDKIPDSSFYFNDTISLIERSIKNSSNHLLFDEELLVSISKNSLAHESLELFNKIHSTMPTVVYLDPMYDEKNDSALPSKAMQILRKELGVGHESDFDKLFTLSLKIALNRVVIKRSIKSKVKFEDKFSFSIFGKSTRYDVYLKN